jgi:hypothetical protein
MSEQFKRAAAEFRLWMRVQGRTRCGWQPNPLDIASEYLSKVTDNSREGKAVG